VAAPHNKKRYGEQWPQWRIEALAELEPIKPWVIFSGGWAWHFMSPQGHDELKHAHDHKDFDVFVPPEKVAIVLVVLNENGFATVPTRYGPGKDDFRRYEKLIDVGDTQKRVTIDLFVREVSFRQHKDGWLYVEPEYLLTLYSDIHSSDNCFAVVAAKKLIDKGIDPEGRKELVEIPSE